MYQLELNVVNNFLSFDVLSRIILCDPYFIAIGFQISSFRDLPGLPGFFCIS